MPVWMLSRQPSCNLEDVEKPDSRQPFIGCGVKGHRLWKVYWGLLEWELMCRGSRVGWKMNGEEDKMKRWAWEFGEEGSHLLSLMESAWQQVFSQFCRLAQELKMMQKNPEVELAEIERGVHWNARWLWDSQENQGFGILLAVGRPFLLPPL